MFDIGASELLLIVIVAVIVIGPKDLPLAMRTAGRWIGKIRRISNHFRAGIDAMIREAELEEMEKTWREHNDAIMKAHPDVPEEADEALPAPAPAPASAEAGAARPPMPEAASPSPEAAARKTGEAGQAGETSEPQLPLSPP